MQKNFVNKIICSNFAPQMGKNGFKIDLLSRGIDGKSFDYTIDDEFFQQIDGLIQRGQLHTNVLVNGNPNSAFRFTIHTEGVICVPCDRCLGDIELRIDINNMLTVKLGDTYSDEGETIIIPERDGYIDMAQPIYEFIALSMPLKLTHEPGNCDATMMACLNEHLSARSGEDNEDE